MDIYKTHTMLMAVRNIAPVTKFLRDRYFPTNDVTDIFATSDVLVDYMDGSKKLAPFVVPRKGGVAVTRKGYTTKRYAPPFIAPKRELTIDDLMRRDFGEAWYSRQTPGERQVALMMRDFDELEAMISRREEAMAAEVLRTNGCVMNHIADELDEPVVAEIHYYDGDENDAVYTPTTAWNATGATILQDIAAAAELLSSRGLPATDLIVSADVGMAILADETILKQLDNAGSSSATSTPSAFPTASRRSRASMLTGTSSPSIPTARPTRPTRAPIRLICPPARRSSRRPTAVARSMAQSRRSIRRTVRSVPMPSAECPSITATRQTTSANCISAAAL